MALRIILPLCAALVGGHGCTFDGSGISGATEGPSTTGEPAPAPDLPPPDEPTGPTGSTGDGSDLPLGGQVTGGDSDSTSSYPPFCGDGVVDPGEECDLGAENANTHACTYFCKHAACGDGYVWTGVEACDNGWMNSPDYGGCALDCQWAARCGDGALDPEHEQCDDGPLNGMTRETGEIAPCNSVCRWYGRIVFISSETYDGNFDTPIGADLECQELAFYAGFEQHQRFRAWISDSWTAPNDRFEYALDDDVPYVLLNGRVLAGDYADLVKSGLQTGISITETGDLVHERHVWTNTTYYGKVADPEPPYSCAGWTSSGADVQASIGLNALVSEKGAAWLTWKSEHLWTDYLVQKCYTQAHLYCFEDGPVGQ